VINSQTLEHGAIVSSMRPSPVQPRVHSSLTSGTHSSSPRRIVCLSDEAVELIYLLGEQDRIVGVSGFSSRPAAVRSKPKVSTFCNANFDAIARLEPDLIITYSDVQADITHEASLRGLTVINCNQRSLTEIFETIAMLSRILGKAPEGDHLIATYQSGLQKISDTAAEFPHRPRVYFEEWNDPLISGIEWVEQLIEIAGGDPIFPELRTCRKAQHRVVTWNSVVERNPDVIFASWCGMKVKEEEIICRPGADQIKAIRTGQIHEISSSLILQPGPAALTEGVHLLQALLSQAIKVDAATTSRARTAMRLPRSTSADPSPSASEAPPSS
jgi:iron complex transport system substrate-binding protein